MGVYASSGIEAIAALTAGSVRAVTEKHAPARWQAPVSAAKYNPELARATIVSIHPVDRAAPSASAANETTPRAVCSRCRRAAGFPAMSDAACGVLIVTASAFSPRTSTVLPKILVCPERRALLLVPVDPPLHRIEAGERQLIRARQQRRPAGQRGQQLPAHHLQAGSSVHQSRSPCDHVRLGQQIGV
jgi:hypothetical protein